MNSFFFTPIAAVSFWAFSLTGLAVGVELEGVTVDTGDSQLDRIEKRVEAIHDRLLAAPAGSIETNALRVPDAGQFLELAQISVRERSIGEAVAPLVSIELFYPKDELNPEGLRQLLRLFTRLARVYQYEDGQDSPREKWLGLTVNLWMARLVKDGKLSDEELSKLLEGQNARSMTAIFGSASRSFTFADLELGVRYDNGRVESVSVNRKSE